MTRSSSTTRNSATASTRCRSRLSPVRGWSSSTTARITNPGFRNGYTNTRVVENGTFLDHGPRGSAHRLLATTGSSTTEHERKKYDLPPQEEWRSPDDPVGLANTMTPDADWVTYEATLSTSADQISADRGLPRARVGGGRAALLPLRDGRTDRSTSTRSCRGGTRSRATSGTDVEIAVYYHPAHKWNVERMIESVKSSLDVLHGGLRAVPAPAGQHRRVPALQSFRAVVLDHHPVLGGHSLRQRPERRREPRHGLLRHRARGGASVVGAPGLRGVGQGRDLHGGELRAVLRAHGDGAGPRPRRDGEVPLVRAGPLPAGQVRKSARRSRRSCWPTTRTTSTTRRAAW